MNGLSLPEAARAWVSRWDGAAGWTGGQYSVFRIALGGYLGVHFAMLLPYAGELFARTGMLPDASASPLLYAFPNVLAVLDAPVFVQVLVALAVLASLLLVLGWHDRAAAAWLWYVSACLVGRNPLISNPALPFLGWLLLAHALIPAAPYGSWSARGRPDPGGGWRLPGGIHAAAWIVMSLGYSYSGFTKLISPSWIDGSALADVLANPLARDTIVRTWLLALPPVLLRCASFGALALELAFAPLALVRRLRPWLWCAMAGMHLGLVVLVDFADLSAGMLLLHAFTFSPAWLPPREVHPAETIVYDGACGLCHRVVRFLLAEDHGAFVLTPRNGEAFSRAAASDARLAELPDSVIVLRNDGSVLARSSAVVYLLDTLGGLWRVLAWLLRCIPRPVRDRGYDTIASVRHRLWRPPERACPLVPAKLRDRFVA